MTRFVSDEKLNVFTDRRCCFWKTSKKRLIFEASMIVDFRFSDELKKVELVELVTRKLKLRKTFVCRKTTIFSRNFWATRRKKLIFVSHFTEKFIDLAEFDLSIFIDRKLSAKYWNERLLIATMIAIVCLNSSLNFSTSRCLIWMNRWNSKARKTIANERESLSTRKKVSLQKAFDT